MKKQLSHLATVLVLTAVGLGVGGAAQAQPSPPRAEQVHPHRPPPKKHKVWVPAHRDHGRLVKGHYVYR